MGVTDLFRELPGGNTKTDTRFGFSKLPVLGSFPASIDTGGLVFLCAHRHKEAYNSGDYLPAAREFQHLITTMNLLHKWKYTLVFDGALPMEKAHEHLRRRCRGGVVIINAEFIDICILICKRHFAKFIR